MGELVHQGEELYQKLTKNTPTCFAPDGKKECHEKFFCGCDPNTHSNDQGLLVYFDQFDKYIATWGNGSDRYTSSGTTIGELKVFSSVYLAQLVDPKLQLPGKLDAFMKRLHADPKVRKVLDETLKDF